MSRVWTCCGVKLPRIKQRCPECGKQRPKRPTASQRALTGSYEEWVARFGEECGICGRGPSARRRLDRDHDHRTGLPRGILCARCNRALPNWVTAAWLRAAAAYLDRSSLQEAA